MNPNQDPHDPKQTGTDQASSPSKQELAPLSEFIERTSVPENEPKGRLRRRLGQTALAVTVAVHGALEDPAMFAGYVYMQRNIGTLKAAIATAAIATIQSAAMAKLISRKTELIGQSEEGEKPKSRLRKFMENRFGRYSDTLLLGVPASTVSEVRNPTGKSINRYISKHATAFGAATGIVYASPIASEIAERIDNPAVLAGAIGFFAYRALKREKVPDGPLWEVHGQNSLSPSEESG